MASSYYYARGGQRFGPVSGSQLKELAASGQLAPDDLVWKDGMADWEPARKLKGLFAIQPPVPPPLPTSPVSAEPAISASDAPTPLFEIDEPTLPAPTTGSSAGWEHRLGRFQPIVDRYGRQLEIAPRPLLALAAGAACLVLLVLATFFTWESYRRGTSNPFMPQRIEEVETHAGVAHAEGKMACVFALGALVFLGVSLAVKRLLAASLLAASAAGTLAFLLAAIYAILIGRKVADEKRELDFAQGLFGGNPLGKEVVKAMDMTFSGDASLGIYLTMLLALAVGAAFIYAGMHKPQPLPFLKKEGVSPFLQKYGALIGAQALAILIGLVWYVARS